MGLGCAGARADEPVPPGLYFHTFTGSAVGSEWSTWRSLGTPGRFEFSDLPADGHYAATIGADGSVDFDGTVGEGMFAADGSADLTFRFGLATVFHSHITRAPYTDAQFPVVVSLPVAGDAALNGQWDATILEVDPATGATIDQTTGVVDVAVDGTTVRLDLPDGSYYIAAWKNTSRAGIRVIEPPPSLPIARTFSGCATSMDQNVVGEVLVLGPLAMSATLCLQTREPFGQQDQSMMHLELTRPAPPSCAGDITGDGVTNASDFTVLAGFFGQTVAPGEFGDLNSDGIVNAADFTILAGDFGCVA
jgi:hypothetical protein